MRTETVTVLRGKSYVPSLARFPGTDELNISGQAEMVPCVTIAHILIQSSPIFQFFFKTVLSITCCTMPLLVELKVASGLILASGAF